LRLTESDDNPGGADAGGRPPRRAVRPKDAASLILWRDSPRGVEVLMGRRHRDMRFMPGVLVFPGGRVDVKDFHARPVSDLAPATRRMLEISAEPTRAGALAACAARELHEESGLALGEVVGREERLMPALGPMHYLTRAITPPDRPIRFHARFLICEAHHAQGEIRGSGELEEVRFFALGELPEQPLALITRLIVEDFSAWLGLSPTQRRRRALHVIQGRDTRRPERSAKRP
jgi:8-oxo-dGTP pyrophosphatase MutT (NUDIX family)